MLVTEIFSAIIIYTSLGIWFFAEPLNDHGWTFFSSHGLLFAYVALGYFLAKYIVVHHHRRGNAFDRAYSFTERSYHIFSNYILLGPLKRDIKHQKKETVSAEWALEDALAEYFYLSSGRHDFSHRYYHFPLRLHSDFPVPFRFEACLKYPFTSIDLFPLKISDNKYIDLTVGHNAFIKEIILPFSLSAFFISVSDCSSLHQITIPCNHVVEIDFYSKDCPISNVPTDFRILVPEHLLPDYCTKYCSVTVKYSDGTTSPVRFSAYIPRSTDALTVPEAKNA